MLFILVVHDDMHIEINRSATVEENNMAKTYSAGVKEYRETYWTPDYSVKETDILACFKITPQDGVPREEVAAACR